MSILDAVRSGYFQAGLCLLPTREDGSKAPAVESWAPFKTIRPTVAQMRAFDFAKRAGVGMIAGAASGHCEAWDFDCPDTYQAFVESAAACGLGDVVHRLIAGYEDETPAGGRRWIVRYPDTVDWQDCTLARRPGRDGEPKVKTLIELPTFAILAPSTGATHPSGKPYVRRSGDFASIASYSLDERNALLALARSFDRMPRPAAHATNATPSGDRPGDDYTRRTSWPEILEPAGWRQVYTRGEATGWCRPGKAHGVSGTTNHAGSDLLFVFSSSTPFDPDKSYTKFAAYAVLTHGGDFKKAARALAKQGYGRQDTTQAPSSVAPDERRRAEAQPVLVRLADVWPESVTWLWLGRLAAGKLTLLVGDPGLGKSWITLDIAARVSAGRGWPDGAPATDPANALLLSAEDGLADTIRPRLDALGADVTRIHHLAVLRCGEKERAIQLADTAMLERAIETTGARVLVIDPVAAFLGPTDSHRDAEVRALMAPLAAVADRTGAAVLGVMHLSKGTQRPAIYRAVGSIAFAASARIVLAVAADPEHDHRHILAGVKNNLSVAPAPLAYSLTNGRLEWRSEPVAKVDVDALLAGPALDRQEHREADAWLRDVLADGRVQSREIQSAARAAGLAWRTVERAKRRLGVKAELDGYGAAGRWYWSLAASASEPTETDTSGEVAVSESNAVNSSNLAGPYSETATRATVAESVADSDRLEASWRSRR